MSISIEANDEMRDIEVEFGTGYNQVLTAFVSLKDDGITICKDRIREPGWLSSLLFGDFESRIDFAVESMKEKRALRDKYNG